MLLLEGFDAWMANPGGDYIAPAFMTWNVDGLPNGARQLPPFVNSRTLMGCTGDAPTLPSSHQ